MTTVRAKTRKKRLLIFLVLEISLMAAHVAYLIDVACQIPYGRTTPGIAARRPTRTSQNVVERYPSLPPDVVMQMVVGIQRTLHGSRSFFALALPTALSNPHSFPRIPGGSRFVLEASIRTTVPDRQQSGATFQSSFDDSGLGPAVEIT